MRTAALIVLAILCVHPSTFAQERDTVFLHGLMSDPAVWEPVASRLASRVAIRPVRPALDWRQLYETQATRLEGQIGGGTSGDVVAVGHSNGGIVAREWSRHRDVGSLITLGSPNQGAPFVNHIFEWLSFADDIFTRISNINAVYTRAVNHDNWWWVPLRWAPLIDNVVDFWDTSRQGLISLGFDLTAPVMPEMRFGSSYMANLNSASSLNQEAIEVPLRAAIVSVAADFSHGGPFRIMKPDSYEDWHDGLLITGIGLDVLAWTIRVSADFDDFGALELADHISVAAEWALQFEEVWCRSVSDPAPLYLAHCYEHDGIVPAWSQAYDYPRVQLFVIPNGPIHTRETAESDEPLFAALTTVAHVPLRSEVPSSGSPSNPAGVAPPSASPPASSTTEGRFKLSGAGCVWDPNDSGPDQCSPPASLGAFKLDGQGNCYWDANAAPPDQCALPPPPTGRFKIGFEGQPCAWDPNDGGPDQCLP